MANIENRCTVCTHSDLNEINEKLVAGLSPRELAPKYNLNHMALYRHKDNHLPKTLIRAKQLQDESAADDLLDRVETIYNKAWELMERAEGDGKYQPAVSALKESRNCLELIGKLLGEIKTGNTINIHYNPQWLTLKNAIYESLSDYPEARYKLVERLNEIEVTADESD